jgi:hypothetical protein
MALFSLTLRLQDGRTNRTATFKVSREIAMGTEYNLKCDRVDERRVHALSLMKSWSEGNRDPVTHWICTRRDARFGVRARRILAAIGYIGLTSADETMKSAARQICEEVMREKL